MTLILSGTDGLSDVDGTAATPAIRGTDANTGIFFPAADTIAFAEGGVESMRIDASGNMGLGVTPSAWGSGYKVIQVGDSAFSNFGTGYVFLTQNALFGASSNTYINTAAASYYRQFNGSHAFFTAASGTAGNTISFTQAMTLDASGNWILGGTTARTRITLQVGEANAPALGTASGGAFFGNSNVTYGTLFGTSGAGYGWIQQQRVDGSATAYDLVLQPSGGNLLMGKTTANDNIAGVQMYGGATAGLVSMAYAGRPLYINRLSTDGDLIDFAQAGTTEGSISVSGTTVSYNGGHLSRYAQTQGAKDESLVKGTVLSNLDEMNVYVAPTTYWTEEDELPEGVSVGDVKVETHSVNNEQLNKVKVSDVEGDANVAGVFVNWSHDNAHNVDEINMAMTGDMIIRIAQGTTVQRGDLLMSAGDGTAKPQGDDIVRSKTVAKVTSTHVTCTYADGSYCVPCVLMAC